MFTASRASCSLDAAGLESPSFFLSVLSTISCDEDDDPVTGPAAAAGSLAACSPSIRNIAGDSTDRPDPAHSKFPKILLTARTPAGHIYPSEIPSQMRSTPIPPPYPYTLIYTYIQYIHGFSLASVAIPFLAIDLLIALRLAYMV